MGQRYTPEFGRTAVRSLTRRTHTNQIEGNQRTRRPHLIGGVTPSGTDQQVGFDDKRETESILQDESEIDRVHHEVRFVPPLCRGFQRARGEHVVFRCSERSHPHWRNEWTTRHCVGFRGQNGDRVLCLVHDNAMVGASGRTSGDNLTKTVISFVNRPGRDESAPLPPRSRGRYFSVVSAFFGPFRK